jgi:acetyltransferase (GNAT) family protein
MTDTPEYRVANGDDAVGIFTVLQEVAPEIPVSLDTPERQEAMQAVVAECCASGESLVAVDADGTVVGFVLAKPDRLERFLYKNQALSLRYIGVNKAWRQRGIFGGLMEKSMAKGVPLTASVLHNNQSAMADRLVKDGYEKVESDAKETRLRWTPTPAVKA